MNCEETVRIYDGLSIPLGTLRFLKQADCQLAFLAMLTISGIKPASRWEKALDATLIDCLRRLGLHVSQVRRTVANGAQVTETLFSKSHAYVEVYVSRWDGMPLDKAPETVQLEGFLFGYPPCCVEEYITNPYTPNDIDPAQQARLFHWACKGCRITPLLLPVYGRLELILESL